jgi:hypothetical protein
MVLRPLQHPKWLGISCSPVFGMFATLFVPPNDTMTGNSEAFFLKQKKVGWCIYFTLISINLHPRAQQMYHSLQTARRGVCVFGVRGGVGNRVPKE